MRDLEDQVHQEQVLLVAAEVAAEAATTRAEKVRSVVAVHTLLQAQPEVVVAVEL